MLKPNSFVGNFFLIHWIIQYGVQLLLAVLMWSSDFEIRSCLEKYWYFVKIYIFNIDSMSLKPIIYFISTAEQMGRLQTATGSTVLDLPNKTKIFDFRLVSEYFEKYRYYNINYYCASIISIQR